MAVRQPCAYSHLDPNTKSGPQTLLRPQIRRRHTYQLRNPGQGVAHVFNTPNEQSRPGYLKMSWQQVGKLPVEVWFRSPVSAASALRVRVPADKSSLPTAVASSAEDVLGDDAEVVSRGRLGPPALEGLPPPCRRLRENEFGPAGSPSAPEIEAMG